MKPDLMYLQHDPAHASCPGLFRSYVKGGDNEPLHLKYTYEVQGATIELEIVSPHLLSDKDLWVLQGLIAMACRDGKNVSLDSPKTDAGKKHSQAMVEGGNAKALVDIKAMLIAGAYTELAREMGCTEPDSWANRKWIQDSFKKLFTVTVFVKAERLLRGYRLLTTFASSIQENTFEIGLNPLIASAVNGTGRYIRIPMDEVRAISKPATRLIHQRLVAFINAGATHPTPISKETLYGYIWHVLDAPPKLRAASHQTDDPDLSAKREKLRLANLERYRRGVLREAIAELTAIHWDFKEVGRGDRYLVTRP